MILFVDFLNSKTYFDQNKAIFQFWVILIKLLCVNFPFHFQDLIFINQFHLNFIIIKYFSLFSR
jgi:hypothetical protein